MTSLSGCSSLAYYSEILNGHFELLEKQQPVSKVIQDKDLKPELRDALIISQEMRDFATHELLLPSNNSYRSYADIGREYAVWNVIATEEFSVKSKQWCFLFVGCLSYRGYFSKVDAEKYASQLQTQGYDTYVAGAKAYSTLGWFDDPLLNTMMFKSEALRAGIIFHELAHQKVYIDDDSAFNEAFATTIEREGVRRWFLKQHDPDKFASYQQSKQRDIDFNQLLQKTRQQLSNLFSQQITDREKRLSKQKIFAELKLNYAELKKTSGDYTGYDNWMAQELNNAHLSLLATYHELVPVFEKILQEQQGDLVSFYQRVAAIGELDSEQRRQALEKYK